MQINLADPTTLTLVVTVINAIATWAFMIGILWTKVNAIWKVYEKAAMGGFFKSDYKLKKEEEDLIPDDMKNELKKLAIKYKKHKENPSKLLYELTRHHIDLIASAADENNIPFNKMMGLATIYIINL